jgi:hypothetical protein
LKRFSELCLGPFLSETRVRWQAFSALLWFLTGSVLESAIITENFTTNPLNREWRVFGDSNLFSFNQGSQCLSVTWDSSSSNSYYYLPLDNVLCRNDDFSVALDLDLSDFHAGVNPGKPSTFELAFGFMNIVDAVKTNFYRGNGALVRNLVEFDFFPESDFAPTIWPSIWSTNSTLNYNGPGDYTIRSLPTGIVIRVVMSYTGSNQTLSTSLTTNGISIGALNNVSLNSSFSDFRVNAFALESYSDLGQDPRYGGSLLAHGRVDNIVLTVPPPPVQDLGITLTSNQWQVSFTSRPHWFYTVERSIDLQTWPAVSTILPGNGQKIFWQDINTPPVLAFYRIRAERP